MFAILWFSGSNESLGTRKPKDSKHLLRWPTREENVSVYNDYIIFIVTVNNIKVVEEIKAFKVDIKCILVQISVYGVYPNIALTWSWSYAISACRH